MTIETPTQIGIANAEEAFDQAYDYDSLAEAIASYWDNVRDTLVDRGMATDANHYEAERAFDARVKLLSAIAA